MTTSTATLSGDLDHQLYLIERHASALRAVGMIALEAATPGKGLHLLGGENLCALCDVLADSLDARTEQVREMLKDGQP